MIKYDRCPACSAAERERLSAKVMQCSRCSCVYGSCTTAHARRYVLDEWDDTKGWEIQQMIPYDFWLTDRDDRIHGWYNPVTRKIVQTG